jgi:hypothetical protein
VGSHGLPDESFICDGLQAACKPNGFGKAATALFLDRPVKTCSYLPAGTLVTAVQQPLNQASILQKLLQIPITNSTHRKKMLLVLVCSNCFVLPLPAA